MNNRHTLIKNSFVMFLILITGLFMSSIGNAANLTAYVDNNIVQVGQFIQLSVTLSEKSSSQKPDFSALNEDFDILSGISTSSQTQIVNGSMSSSTTWTITISPKHEGAIVIPPIKLAGLETEAITVVVGKAPAKEFSDAFFETKVSKKSVYVQEQIRFDLNLYIRMSDLSSTQLDDLKISDAKLIKAGEDKQSQIQQNGIRYYLIEKSYFIFPEKSGVLNIPSLRFNAVVNEGSRYSRYGTQRRISAMSEQISIKVNAIPDAFPKNAIWLPAEQVILAETFSPGEEANVGDPITRTIVTKATGLIGAALPPAELKEIAGLKIYPDEGSSKEVLSGNSIVATRNDSFALIANKAGNINLPAYKIAWWDTKNDKLRYAELEERTLNFSANANQPSSANNININEANTADENTADSHQATQSNKELLWILSAVFLAIWLITVFAFVYYIQKLKRESGTQDESEYMSGASSSFSDSEKKALNEFNQACKQNNPQLARATLIDWLKLHFPNENIEGLSQLSYKLEGQEENKALVEQLNKLDKHLYANLNDQVKLSELNRLFNAWIKNLNQESKKKEKGKNLSNLYSKD